MLITQGRSGFELTSLQNESSHAHYSCLSESANCLLSQDVLKVAVRFMDIRPFERTIEIADFEHLIRSRLGQKTVLWPEQACALASYMGWPNDAPAREIAIRTLQGWQSGSRAVPPRLRQIQIDWARVADIVNLHHDLNIGGHQRSRGGASVGKAIEIIAHLSKMRGVSKANLWKAWKTYKDVAHLVTSAVIITAEARQTSKIKAFGEFGLATGQQQPILITMLIPEFVLSVALYLQDYGLGYIPHARRRPMLDPKTAWRIGPEVEVAPIPPPARRIGRPGLGILNARRAGNRGRANQRKTTPVSA